MELTVNGRKAYAYTGGKTFDAKQPTVIFVHGAQCDHSVWILQSRYLAHHGYGVLALDLPRHLYHFTPATFAFAARRAGLRIESVATYSRRHNAGMWTSSLVPGLQKQRLHLLSQTSKTRAYSGAAAYFALTAAARPLARAEASLGLSPIRSFFLVPS